MDLALQVWASELQRFVSVEESEHGGRTTKLGGSWRCVQGVC